MARRRPSGATLYDFRDIDIMLRLAEHNGEPVGTFDLADDLGFDAEEGGRPVGTRLAWMRRYGMVAFNESERSWSLTTGGRRVTSAHLRAPELRVVDKMPDEKMVDVMAHVMSRYGRGESMLAAMLRREFLFGTKRR